ncbi:MAG: HAD-IIIC family phosphatase [Nanoarchaeota archaeon]|nr:HAD-IIIC family phosphatase [Nanoarchaeota archaeon]
MNKGIKRDSPMPEIKVAFLSNFTINGLPEILKVKSHQESIWIDYYNAPYNQYIQEILNPASGLYKKEPDLIFLLLDVEPFLGEFFFFPYRYSIEQRKDLVKEKIKEIEDFLTILQERSKAKIVINEFLVPAYSSRGILESKQEYGLTESIHKINEQLRDICKNNGRLFTFPLNSFCSHQKSNPLSEPKIYYLTDMKFSTDGLIDLASEYLSYIYPLASKSKKCLVLDLDNTLWGGVVGEDGPEGLKLGPDKEGRPFLDFQKLLLDLFERGIILAINSKNNYEDAMEVIRNHKYMLLREDHFACIKINWQDKATNMKEIAKELEIGLDSLVFLDDDSTNQALIRELVPEVTVIDLPKDVSLYPSIIKNLKFFNLFHITPEDVKRGKMYVDQKKRSLLESEMKDLNTFIKQLQVKVMVRSADESTLDRITQLTQKTNQFNLTTKRYQEEEIYELFKSADHLIKSITVEDKFGDYGTTGVVIVKKDADKRCWHIDTFLLSCRVLGKTVEFALMEDLIKRAKMEGIENIKGHFIPTKKNKPAENFLEECGFVLSKEDDQIKEYTFDFSKEFKTRILVDVEEWKS